MIKLLLLVFVINCNDEAPKADPISTKCQVTVAADQKKEKSRRMLGETEDFFNQDQTEEIRHKDVIEKTQTVEESE